MENLLALPAPGFIVIIGVVLALKVEFVLSQVEKFCAFVGVGHWCKVLLFFMVLFIPLCFASWQGLEGIEIIGRVICYILLMILAIFFGGFDR